MKKGRPPKRKLKEGSQNKAEAGDDFEYLNEESDQSFGDDDVDLSDSESMRRAAKRRHQRGSSVKDSGRSKKSGTPTAIMTPTPVLDNDSDYDEIGETKVDRGGNLLGGRQYKVPTFALPERGNMLFMFSKDPAALLGFRDSFVFLKKNPKLVKVHVTDDEKGYLVQQNLLRSTFRTREVSVVTARSVYKQFGHRVLRKGRRGRDDYYYTGEDEGDLGDEQSEEEQKDDKAWSPFVLSGRNNLTSRRLVGKVVAPATNELNYLHHAALSIRNFNTQLCDYRRDNPTFFDIHTNVMQLPASKQPVRLLYEPKKIEERISKAAPTIENKSDSQNSTSAAPAEPAEGDPASSVAAGSSAAQDLQQAKAESLADPSQQSQVSGTNHPGATSQQRTYPTQLSQQKQQQQQQQAPQTPQQAQAQVQLQQPHQHQQQQQQQSQQQQQQPQAQAMMNRPPPQMANNPLYYQQMAAMGQQQRPPMGFSPQQQMMMQQGQGQGQGQGMSPAYTASMSGINPYQFMNPGTM